DRSASPHQSTSEQVSILARSQLMLLVVDWPATLIGQNNVAVDNAIVADNDLAGECSLRWPNLNCELFNFVGHLNPRFGYSIGTFSFPVRIRSSIVIKPASTETEPSSNWACSCSMLRPWSRYCSAKAMPAPSNVSRLPSRGHAQGRSLPQERIAAACSIGV